MPLLGSVCGISDHRDVPCDVPFHSPQALSAPLPSRLPSSASATVATAVPALPPATAALPQAEVETLLRLARSMGGALNRLFGCCSFCCNSAASASLAAGTSDGQAPIIFGGAHCPGIGIAFSFG